MSKTLYSLAVLSMVLFVVSCKKDFEENKVPVADAGQSKTITFPDSVVLSGTGTDADGKVVAYLWSQVSGPTNTTIVNPGSASTAIRFVAQGSYVFQLMVTDDKGATGVDTVAVLVNPPVVTTKTLTLQPNNNPLEYTIATLNGSDASGLTQASLEADAWTSGGPFTLRGVVKFDLSSIPATATIKSANLYLYSNPAPTTGDQIHANYGTANAMYVQQVTSNWSTSTVSWSNQPTVTTTNQILVPHTNSSTLDLNLDVTAMVGSMVNNNANYGFFLKLQNEVTYNSRIFVASHNATYPDKHPKLVVIYQ
ncbi:hypothetical protein A3860_10835 [Niastella vici]|uniref:PKD/Chitinase domain-containing protein n=1 Tax=Niastella vici TaxID=1703345 RepID=A0A1V9FFQ5_9BACT|nr:DNRLRE domain-containing protein [Niastella vici]OQP57056.1 hypothetical protein A3860_10835 [Niastella vici]